MSKGTDTQTYPLGRNNDIPHDPRNLLYPKSVSGVPLHAVAWRRNGPPLDQGQVGSCTGNALAGWLNTTGGGYVPGHGLKSEADAQGYYHRGTQVDGFPGVWPPQDTGSTGPAVCKAAKRDGLITAYDHAFGLDHLLNALMTGPAMQGTVWTQGMFTPGPDGLVAPTGSIVGGHEYLACGYDPATGLVEYQQSWGSWGVGGYFYMHHDDVAWLLGQRGDVTVPRK